MLRLRIFTPGKEMDFAGHPTLGAAYVLAATGRLPLQEGETRIIFEEWVGPVGVTIRVADGKPAFIQLSAAKMPEFGPPPPPAAELAGMLCLEKAEVLEGRYAPQAVSCGVPFLFIPLASLAALGRAKLEPSRWEKTLGAYWARDVYLFTLQDRENSGVDLQARMFGPTLNIPEDPATGAAATAIAGYLSPRDSSAAGRLQWKIAQGIEMGRPSYLEVEADRRGGAIAAIRVGGAAVLVSEGRMIVPSLDDPAA
jgi:trans-2,3-dihydro-3-hydroxyanthranilate isomerase